jgi:hypothetical protein
MIFAGVLVLVALAAIPANRGGATSQDLAKAEAVYLEAYNDCWARPSRVFSPNSPDYVDRLRQRWAKCEVGQKFRELDRVMRGRRK